MATHPHHLRRAGMLVAVELNDPNRQDQVAAFLITQGAINVEKSDGEIVNGDWRLARFRPP